MTEIHFALRDRPDPDGPIVTKKVRVREVRFFESEEGWLSIILDLEDGGRVELGPYKRAT